MRKIDRLILGAFAGPFLLTFFVVVFIFLIQYLIKYFPDLVGKGLGPEVYLELLFYFSINVTPISMPLSILLASLIAYGNLGEHFELTAIKSAGISLVRTLVPILLFSLLLCVAAFFINNNMVPKANLKAFSLLYDLRQKKPTFEFKEGTFYNGIPGYSIKVNDKDEDGSRMRQIMIYNHSEGRGNTEVTLADSGKMYLTNGDQMLVMELYKCNSLKEMLENHKPDNQQFVRSQYKKGTFFFSLESFNLQRTKEELFSSHKIMRNVKELSKDVDSLTHQADSLTIITYESVKPFYNFMYKSDTTRIRMDIGKKIDYTKDTLQRANVLKYANNISKSVKSYINAQADRYRNYSKEANSYSIEWHKKFTFSFACLVMFLIGAPLGSIIKKGGLGVPVIISIVFFIFYYTFSIIMEKWSKEGIVDTALGMWFTNLLFLPIGIFFLRQARNDSRILETDYLRVWWSFLSGIFYKK